MTFGTAGLASLVMLFAGFNQASTRTVEGTAGQMGGGLC